MKTSPLSNVIAFVLERSESLPITQRANLYLDLAAICGDETEAANLRAVSASLRDADSLCREFIFSFSQKQNSLTQKNAGR